MTFWFIGNGMLAMQTSWAAAAAYLTTLAQQNDSIFIRHFRTWQTKAYRLPIQCCSFPKKCLNVKKKVERNYYEMPKLSYTFQANRKGLCFMCVFFELMMLLFLKLRHFDLYTSNGIWIFFIYSNHIASCTKDPFVNKTIEFKTKGVACQG